MNQMFYSDFNLLTLAFALQLISIAFVWFKNQNKSLYYSNIILALGLIIGFISTLSSALFSPDKIQSHGFFYNFIRFDGLGLYFLFIIQLVAIPTTIFNLSYLKHHIDQSKSIRSFVISYVILLVSTQLLVIANHSILFLVCWEVMSMSAYTAMILEKEKEEVQRGSFYYFAVSHILIFILYIMFFLIHNETGSWFFNEYRLSFSDNIVISIIFILSLIGFGIKAGFMPFHFWLPQAHPVAPTVLSAFLSGIIIKMGIYGILRTYLFLKPLPEWTGWVILIVSIISAILGVWYALAQHDIKRLLAYHSIENIGIIGLGIGIGFIGSANKLPAVEALGFGGALLHTLNHAIFKSLLFIGSGVVYNNLGTRNIEFMGGIVHRAKYLSLFFLIGSIAISGVPPFNGFVSEFIIYSGFIKTANRLQNYYPIIMLIFVVGLAFVGGLAVACFTKVNSIMFLGTERTKIKHFHTSVFDYISLGTLAFLCILIGFYPQPFVGIVNKVIGNDFVSTSQSSALVSINWLYLTLIFSFIAFAVVILYFLKLKHEKKFGKRKSAAWACGYENVTPRMQYTASSFADELIEIPQSLLLYHKEVTISENTYPLISKFKSHSKDFIDIKIILPFYRWLSSLISRITILSQTDIRYYIGFILIIISIYSLLAFIWS